MNSNNKIPDENISVQKDLDENIKMNMGQIKPINKEKKKEVETNEQLSRNRERIIFVERDIESILRRIKHRIKKQIFTEYMDLII